MIGAGRRRGFSLLELVVVSAVLLILTAMIVPQFLGTYQGVLLRSSGREVLSALNLAASQAVTTGRPHRLQLDPARGRFWMEARGGEAGQEQGFEAVPGLPGARGAVDRRISLELGSRGRPRGEAGPAEAPVPPSEPEGILFRPDGTAEAADIVLRDRDGFGLLLSVHPTTARVRVSSLGREPRP